MTEATSDPLQCNVIRQRVLGIWAADPARLREDANHERDLVHGGYADRVVVELAANAADAAAEAGVPGRLLFRLDVDPAGTAVLLAANTGAPLSAAGLAGLVSLRASAKAEDRRSGSETGRFGVGFASVLTITDRPAIASANGAVIEFSAERTREALASHPDLPLAAGNSELPTLRLPFVPDAQPALRPPAGYDPVVRPPEGYDTVVRLPLRDAAALAAVRRQLDELDDLLLLGLPGLAEVLIEDRLSPQSPDRALSDPTQRWVTLSRSGSHLAQDRAASLREDHRRSGWRLTWALPRPPRRLRTDDRVIRAPTPSGERLEWPAVLIADLPLEPSRQQVVAGPIADRVLREAAEAYAELLCELAAQPDPASAPLALLPTAPPGGWLDAQLRALLWEALPHKQFLRPVGGGEPIRPVQAIVLEGPAGDDPGILAALVGVAPGLVRAPVAVQGLLGRLGAGVHELAEVVEQWRPDATLGWALGYRALAGLLSDSAAREALAGLPVPVLPADPVGEDDEPVLINGPRGVLLPGADVPDSLCRVLAATGCRLLDRREADPAAEDLLERLGAQRLSAEQLLAGELLADAVERAEDPELALQLSAGVLDLLAAVTGDQPAGPAPWMADLLIPDSDAEPVEAALLVLPGSTMDPLLDPDDLGRVEVEWATRWPVEVWQALGVPATGPVLFDLPQVDLTDPPPELADLDGFREWADRCAEHHPGPVRVRGIRDPELVIEAAWPRVIGLLPTDFIDELSPGGDDGYLTWWLRREFRLAERRDEHSAGCLRWLPPATPALTAQSGATRLRLRAVTSPDDLTETGWRLLLQRMADPEQPPPSPSELIELWRALGAAALRWHLRAPRLRPEKLWAIELGECPHPVLVTADQAFVVEDPRWLQRDDLGPVLVPGAATAEALADLLDLDLAGDRAAGQVTSLGVPTPIPATLASLDLAPTLVWQRHDRLLVDGRPVRWWLAGDTLHAVDHDGLADALAAGTGHFRDRFRIAALLSGADATRLLLDDADAF